MAGVDAGALGEVETRATAAAGAGLGAGSDAGAGARVMSLVVVFEAGGLGGGAVALIC